MTNRESKLSNRQQTSRLLQPTLAQSSIKAFNSRRIRSRNGKQKFRVYTPSRYKISVSSLGDVFQAAQRVFRNSLAFHYPLQIGSRSSRKQFNRMWRNDIRGREYEQSKTKQIKQSQYISNYKLPEKQIWYKGKHI